MNYIRAVIVIIICFPTCIFGQETDVPIKEMNWDRETDLEIKMANDTNYTYNIKALYHHRTGNISGKSDEFTYYPVVIDPNFIEDLQERRIDLKTVDTSSTSANPKATTLWSAIHASIGGGWIHFMNCVLYALETQQLEISAPLMIRPETEWKPKPVTETYRRTRKWKYYVPVDQRCAKKEYRIKRRKGELNNLEDLPAEFVDLFMKTSNSAYQKYIEEEKYHIVARIDLIKILLGANYLGQTQIDYIQSKVLTSVLQYNYNQLPTVIIFDELDAAVAMSLDENGYRIKKIVFNNQRGMNELEVKSKKLQIHAIVNNINETNQKLFEEKLKKYYN